MYFLAPFKQPNKPNKPNKTKQPNKPNKPPQPDLPQCKYCYLTQPELQTNKLLYPCNCTTPICNSCFDVQISQNKDHKCEICRTQLGIPTPLFLSLDDPGSTRLKPNSHITVFNINISSSNLKFLLLTFPFFYFCSNMNLLIDVFTRTVEQHQHQHQHQHQNNIISHMFQMFVYQNPFQHSSVKEMFVLLPIVILTSISCVIGADTATLYKPKSDYVRMGKICYHTKYFKRVFVYNMCMLLMGSCIPFSFHPFTVFIMWFIMSLFGMIASVAV